MMVFWETNPLICQINTNPIMHRIMLKSTFLQLLLSNPVVLGMKMEQKNFVEAVLVHEEEQSLNWTEIPTIN